MSHTTIHTSPSHPGKALRWLACAILLVLSGIGTLGCTSVDSDLPWNSQPSWQGSPSMPGLGPNGN